MMRRMAAPVWAGAVVVMLSVAASQLEAQQPDVNGMAGDRVPVSLAQSVVTATPPEAVSPTSPASEAQASTVADRFRPTVSSERLLAPAQAPAAERQLVHQPAYRSRTGVPLMVVGGAMFLAGAIIDSKAGDAVMVAGVVVAAIGLLEYLQ